MIGFFYAVHLSVYGLNSVFYLCFVVYLTKFNLHLSVVTRSRSLVFVESTPLR